MTIYESFPDAEALAAGVLRDELEARVYSSIPKTPTYPLIVVQRLGGMPAERHRLDAARLQIDVWGNNKSEAHDLAQDARATLHGMEGTQYLVGGGGPIDAFVTAVDDSLGLTWLPDPETNRDRYIFGVTVFLHA